MSFLFSDISNVAYFNIDPWDTSNVTSNVTNINSTFFGCTSLPLVDKVLFLVLLIF
jgi:hypothetical protein